MEVHCLPLEKFRWQGSRYRFSQKTEWNPADPFHKALAPSLQQVGIIQPLLLHEYTPGDLHLVDGFHRVSFAKAMNWKEVPCLILDSNVPGEAVWEILFLEHSSVILSTPTSRCRFVAHLLSHQVSRSHLCHHLLPLLEFEGHPNMLEKCEKVAALPDEVLEFCHEKRFSMKQCLHLARHPRDLLLAVFSWKDSLWLTASIIEELLENLKDYCRAQGKTVSDFIRESDIEPLLLSSQSPQEKTKVIRERIRRTRFPVLTDVNEKMDGLAEKMELPQNVKLQWDKTLEQREIRMMIQLRDPEQWEQTLGQLQAARIPKGIDGLFENL